ncbi:MAG: amino-acid N-acetyltransferase, partial [Verrucomicrobiota bacterium]
MNFRDLRAILQYVPQFRGQTFVIAVDGSVVDSPEFSDILLDLAVLRSLSIRVVLVHGAAAQIAALGEKRGVALSTLDGTGSTDAATLEISMDAISRLSNGILQSLTTVKIQAATANAIHAHPAGILGGVDAGFTGTIERIDSDVLQSFLEQDIVPVVPPLGFDGDGQILRVNSDIVAREVASALGAAKILFISHEDPLGYLGKEDRQWSTDHTADFLRQQSNLPSGVVSKLNQAIRATEDGVPRVHLISCDSDDALLAELFSNEGVGIMIYSDAYQRLRGATRNDVDELRLLIHRAVEDEQLLPRSRAELIAHVDDYLVMEIDGHVVGCVAVHYYPDERMAELACLCVKKGHTWRGLECFFVNVPLNCLRSLY